ncbi:hypothetical protein C1I89_22285 [Achromobacter pulmonis]|uniref:Uncharacterized protein n=1 Tax=Achromobacter pulmonis TaxID=1389932 RepID=A0A2N8KDP5_9BURK|nr:hypothetical protein [Achromobacter pulmonis]PND31569.1 hypothetical protein C1I89_22285 [Achromobacter pulmonis]
MKFAKEIIGLMAAYPGRDFRMVELVRHATGARELAPRERERDRKAITRVLAQLAEAGHILRRPTRSGVRNSLCYRWKSGT